MILRSPVLDLMVSLNHEVDGTAVQIRKSDALSLLR